MANPDLIKAVKDMWFQYHFMVEAHRLIVERKIDQASGNFSTTVLQVDCRDPICVAIREALKAEDGNRESGIGVRGT